MSRRLSLGKWYRLRWQVLERDNFTCQYCGQSAPNVKLEVDHKIALADGGTNDLNNLVVSCYACNRGKNIIRFFITTPKAFSDDRKNTQANILEVLKKKPLTPGQIAEKVDIKLTNARVAIHRLSKCGDIVKTGRTWNLSSEF